MPFTKENARENAQKAVAARQESSEQVILRKALRVTSKLLRSKRESVRLTAALGVLRVFREAGVKPAARDLRVVFGVEGVPAASADADAAPPNNEHLGEG